MSVLFDAFKARAEAVSAEVHRFPRKSEALTFIAGYLREQGICDAPDSYAVWAQCPIVSDEDKRTLSSSLPGLVFDVTRESAAAAMVGISQFDWAMASTGTLVQDAAPVDRRLVSTLPVVHIALVETAKLVPDLATLITKIRPEQTRYLSFITGPSRTADIERVLTIGVHGPEKLIIVFVDERGEMN